MIYITKSGAEKHAAQLEKWVSQYYLTYNTKPKAILIVNTFRDIPLLERNETSFPEQMLDYCEKRGHCLITGQQLLSLYLDCKNNDEKKSRMIEIMFNTDGIIGEYQNWSDHIKFESEVNELSDRPEQ